MKREDMQFIIHKTIDTNSLCDILSVAWCVTERESAGADNFLKIACINPELSIVDLNEE
jgi:hypothetical protein